MGEARRRGTFEQRKLQSIEANKVKQTKIQPRPIRKKLPVMMAIAVMMNRNL